VEATDRTPGPGPPPLPALVHPGAACRRRPWRYCRRTEGSARGPSTGGRPLPRPARGVQAASPRPDRPGSRRL